MTKEQEEAIDRLKRIDIKYFIRGRMEKSNYIIDEADKTNEAIETVLSMLEEKDKEIEILTQQRDYYKERYNEFNKAFINNLNEGGKHGKIK